VNDDKHEVEVRVKSLKTGETVKFEVLETTTLQSVWDAALTKLNETRNAGDTFRCSNGQDLTSFLNHTLVQLHKERICPDRHFEIKGPSGGAIA
jgi:hypothetical protein